MTTTIDRRTLLRAGLTGVGGLAFGAAFYERAFAAAPATPGPGPYGPLGPPDANGLSLPAGFTSRKIAQGLEPVAGTAYPWHVFTDGQATFPLPDGGWVLVANSEAPAVAGGGASAIDFAPDGRIQAARRILAGTNVNCAGGPTPWGTWLSCEEQEAGLVWECDPQGLRPALPRPAMGTFTHEAACVDPARRRVYVTEDRPDGCLYRFTPEAYPDLARGLLEVALVDARGRVTWREVPQPNPVPRVDTPAREQVPGARRFAGGEGMWFDSGTVYFTAKGEDHAEARGGGRRAPRPGGPRRAARGGQRDRRRRVQPARRPALLRRPAHGGGRRGLRGAGAVPPVGGAQTRNAASSRATPTGSS